MCFLLRCKMNVERYKLMVNRLGWREIKSLAETTKP
jgi:hypothetical protein